MSGDPTNCTRIGINGRGSFTLQL
ncbi:hypothetical protein MED222_05555 [Vibrio sp. MED222]|nr:hypothetical protein MED222_05555 [Vibrio sp. MED222]